MSGNLDISVSQIKIIKELLKSKNWFNLKVFYSTPNLKNIFIYGEKNGQIII